MLRCADREWGIEARTGQDPRWRVLRADVTHFSAAPVDHPNQGGRLPGRRVDRVFGTVDEPTCLCELPGRESSMSFTRQRSGRSDWARRRPVSQPEALESRQLLAVGHGGDLSVAMATHRSICHQSDHASARAVPVLEADQPQQSQQPRPQQRRQGRHAAPIGPATSGSSRSTGRAR